MRIKDTLKNSRELSDVCLERVKGEGNYQNFTKCSEIISLFQEFIYHLITHTYKYITAKDCLLMSYSVNHVVCKSVHFFILTKSK